MTVLTFEACKQVVRECGLQDRVTFTGWVEQEELQQYYKTARCGVVPSLWPEPIATIGLELMQHALPVVGFDAGGIGEWLIDGENGYLVPTGDVAGMGHAIEKVLASAEHARALGQDGLAKGKEWHCYEGYLDQLAAVLRQHALQRTAAA